MFFSCPGTDESILDSPPGVKTWRIISGLSCTLLYYFVLAFVALVMGFALCYGKSNNLN
jgi:hypothetical protein